MKKFIFRPNNGEKLAKIIFENLPASFLEEFDGEECEIDEDNNWDMDDEDDWDDNGQAIVKSNKSYNIKFEGNGWFVQLNAIGGEYIETQGI
jgi:hypothetical protein